MPEPATLTLVGTGFMAMTVQFFRQRYHSAKPCFDRACAALLLVLFAPVIAICALITRLTSRGPAFYTQKRVGENGRVFDILKLRTMRLDAETRSGPVWSSGAADSRVTPFGRFLRASHLDETPQLINVLRGEMSLVGPRPERPHFVEQLSKDIPEYEKRLAVKPGITGLAQIRSGYDHSLRDVRKKVKLDIMYIRKMCWWVDFVIIALTLRKFAGRD